MTTLVNVKVTQKCQIVLEDILESLPLVALQNNRITVPTQTVNGKITSRRHSVRLLQTNIPYMKVAPFRVWKKRRNISRIRQEHLTDGKHSNLTSQEKLTDAQQPNDKSFDTTNCNDQLTAALTELSSLDVNTLIDEIKSFIENGEFESFIENEDELQLRFESVASVDETNSNLNCLPLDPEPLSAEPDSSTPVSTTPTDFIPPIASVNEISNEIFGLDEIGDSPLDLSIYKAKSTGPEWKPKVISYGLDLPINEIKSTEWKANIIAANVQQIESSSQKSSPTLCTYRNDLIESEKSSTIPHATAKTLSAYCSSNELANSNTVITSKLNKDLSPSPSTMIVDSIQKNTKGNDSAIRSKKRKMNGQPKQKKPCQIVRQNCNVENCSTNRFNFKIPKLEKLPTEENISKVLHEQAVSQNFSKVHSNNRGQLNLTLSQDDSRSISATSKKVFTQPQSSTTSSPNSISTQTKSFTLNQRKRPMQRENCPQLKAQLLMTAAKPQNSFVAMQKMVVRLLDGPCFKFLRNEDCGAYCRYNHLLPSTDIVTATIKNWPNELIHYFYLACVQQHMCFIMYFPVVCNIFAERRMIHSLLATVKDCERLSNEHYFKSIFVALMQLGMKPDQSLFLLCSNSNRSRASIEVILEIMCSFNLSNFAKTAVFITTQIENYEINPILAIKILEKAYADSPLNTVMCNFCIKIFHKSLKNETFNQKLMEFFLMKILT